MDEGPFLVNFLPLLGGQKAAVSDSVEGWCAAGNLGASRVSIRMDDWTDGQRDDGTDSEDASFHPHYIWILSIATVRPASGEASLFLYYM
jgi:hypothetical protein